MVSSFSIGSVGYRRTAIILTTAIPEHVGRERGLLTGEAGYLQKPVQQDAPEKLVRRLVKRIRPELARDGDSGAAAGEPR